MARLKNRQMQIPGGLKFYQPETRWRPQPFHSFHMIVTTLIAHRNANPALRDQHGWSTDQTAVEDEVDEFNARMCEQAGWTEYIQAPIGMAPPPFFPAPSPMDQSALSVAAGAAKKVWAGVRTLHDWLDSGESAVPPEQSAARAAVCVQCPKNGQGEFTKWFTRPAAEAIKVLMERTQDRRLSTPHDATLNICEVCYCPMKLKVHTPLSFINSHLTQQVLDELAVANPNCWIVAERKA